MTETFSEALAARTQDVLDNGTRCRRCFEVCPMTAPAGIADKDATKVVGGVLDIIRGGSGSTESERWAQVGYMCNTLQPLPAFKRDVHR